MDSDDCVDLNHADECPQGWPMSFGQKGRLKSKKKKQKQKTDLGTCSWKLAGKL